MTLEQMIKDIVREAVREELRASAATPTGLVTIKAFAAARSISPSTVRAAIASGRLAATKIGRAVRVAVDAQIEPAAMATTDTPTARAERRLGLVAPPGGRR